MRKLTFGEVLQDLIDSKLMQVHTTMPAKVEKYDSDKQLADVQPLLKLPTRGDDGKVRWYRLPVVTAVPVMFPGAGDFRIVFPIKKGNTGKLTFAESSLDKWIENGGLVTPDDLRRFHLSDGIFTPGLNPKNKAWQDAAGDFFTIGKDSETAQWVALANIVKDRLDSIVGTFNSHTHSISGTADLSSLGGTTGSVTGSTGAGPANNGDNAVASASVKIKG